MTDETPVEVELYVRCLATCESQPGIESLVDRLEALQAASDGGGPIDEISVHVWGDRLGLSETVTGTDVGARLHDRIREFREWAHDNDVELVGGFEHVRRNSVITGRVHEFLTLPPVVLAERRDGELVWVAPHRNEEVTRTAREWLETVEDLGGGTGVGAATPADD